MHARVAFYKLRSGSFEQVVGMVAAPWGLLEIFRGRPGFQSYELIEAPAGLISVSHWESSAQAERRAPARARLAELFRLGCAVQMMSDRRSRRTPCTKASRSGPVLGAWPLRDPPSRRAHRQVS
jgi:hypothetical protein